MRRQGTTLLEAVIASFLLLISLLVITNLFHSSLGYLPRIENQQLAALLAERHLEGMRVWCNSPNGNLYNYDSPGVAAIYNGSTVTYPEHSQFQVLTNVTTGELYSPCSNFELGLVTSPPFGVRRSLQQWASKVTVAVRWDGGARQLRLSSLIARPALAFRHNINRIVVQQTSGTPVLHAGESALFSAVGYDENDNPIPDLKFVWDICPVNATGRLEQARDGSAASLTNRIMVAPFTAAQSPPYSGTISSSSGELYVRASARYHGQVAAANSSLVQLAP